MIAELWSRGRTRDFSSSITDLITAVVQLLQRDINRIVETALGELELVKL